MKSIIEAIEDDNLFRPFLADKSDSLRSWRPWMAALRCLYGLQVPKARHEFVQQVTGRTVDTMPSDGFKTALFLTGRRSGKSRCGAAIPAAFEAVVAGHEHKLARGEKGIVAVCSPTRSQSRIVKGYLREIFNSSEMLHSQVTSEDRHGFDLQNGVRIEILTGDFRTVRGFTLLAAVIDEIAFFGVDEESKIKSDTELVRAIKPSLATTGGRLIAISSPYARKGWCYKTHQRHWGSSTSKTLVVNAPSRVMNPTLSQEVVDEALAEDLAAAKAEYLGEFRDDVGAFITREVVERCVIRDRTENTPQPGVRHVAFIDMSGGRTDDAALCIAHKKGRMVCIDSLTRFRPPFNPYEVIGRMAGVMKRWGIRMATADNYAAQFVTEAGQSHGVVIRRAEKPKSQLYLELLPKITSNEIELLDDETSISQLANLERRTRSGGRDVIDHPPGQHDDLANVIAGAAELASTRILQIGALRSRT